VSWGAQAVWYETTAGHDVHARGAFDLGAQAARSGRDQGGARRTLTNVPEKGTQHEKAEKEKVESVSAELQAKVERKAQVEADLKEYEDSRWQTSSRL